jgi:broad specificity phosphatase PhoE
MNDSVQPNLPPKPKGKTVVLIRHSQSNENVKVVRMFEGLNRLRNLKPPTLQQIGSTLSIASLTVDSLVSPLGRRQILDMHMILRDQKFWERQKFDLILCSPLIRAQETCEGLLPEKREGIVVMTRADLEEATPFEHVFSGGLVTRIEHFKRWLATRKEEKILIIGHSQYFKRMLGQTSLMRNCDVWQCNFATDSGIDGTAKMAFEWTDLTLLHRTELSEIHPYDGAKLKNSKKGKSVETMGEDVDDDLNGDDPTCRICQVRLFSINVHLIDGNVSL